MEHGTEIAVAFRAKQGVWGDAAGLIFYIWFYVNKCNTGFKFNLNIEIGYKRAELMVKIGCYVLPIICFFGI